MCKFQVPRVGFDFLAVLFPRLVGFVQMVALCGEKKSKQLSTSHLPTISRNPVVKLKLRSVGRRVAKSYCFNTV